MKVFISWSGSGTLSQKVAELLRDWLPSVIQSVKPYLSSEDTYKGSRWRDKVAQELESSNYGILCVTPENILSPWLNFEAGALSKKFEGSHVSPFLIRLKATDLESGPLSQYQATIYHDKKDVFQLVRSINDALEKPLELLQLDRAFEAWWRALKDPIDQLIKDYSKSSIIETKSRSIEDALSELLVLTRGQQKALADVKQTWQSTPANAAIMVNGVEFRDVKFLLDKAYSVADEAAIQARSDKRPENQALVQIRGLIGVIERTIFGKISNTPNR
jgi:hypothetical protein